MRFGSFTYVVVLFGAGLAGTLVNVTRSAEPGPDPLAGPPKVVTWADPHAADVSAELDAARAVVRARIGERVALAAALVRGERTLEDVAERFKELNAEVPA